MPSAAKLETKQDDPEKFEVNFHKKDLAMKSTQGSSLTLTIQEVSERMNVTKHTLRFWEKELAGLLVPIRTEGGQRRYTLENILVIQEIKRLKREGLSLSSIRGRLKSVGHTVLDNSDPRAIESLAEHVAESVKTAIYSFFQGNDSS